MGCWLTIKSTVLTFDSHHYAQAVTFNTMYLCSIKTQKQEKSGEKKIEEEKQEIKIRANDKCWKFLYYFLKHAISLQIKLR